MAAYEMPQIYHMTRPCTVLIKDIHSTFSSKLPSDLDDSVISASREEANSNALNAHSVVTAVTLLIPLAIPSSDRRANALASRVFDI